MFTMHKISTVAVVAQAVRLEREDAGFHRPPPSGHKIFLFGHLRGKGPNCSIAFQPRLCVFCRTQLVINILKKVRVASLL